MWDKLKHEWKTFVWGIVAIATEASLYADPTLFDAFIPEEYKQIVHVALVVGFFVLRQWKPQSETV